MTGRSGLLLLHLAVIVFFAPVWMRGEVVFPHDNRIESLAAETPGSPSPRAYSNRKFSDQSSTYVPEIHHHLRGDASRWIASWNPQVGLGRPTLQLFGFGKAFLVTHVLSVLSDDAFLVYTVLALLAVYGTTLFAFLFLDSLRLLPLASLTGALGLGLGVFCSYWLTFAMYTWTLCWTLAILLGVERTLQRATALRWLGLAFSTHALLLTGYPQQIVWHAYLVAGYVLWRLFARRPGGPRPAAALALLASAALVGLVSAAPVLLDLWVQAQQSARADIETGFFLAVRPRLADGPAIGLFVAQLYDAFVFGNPVDPSYRAPFNGTSLTPLYATLLVVSFFDGQWRRLWPWQLFLLANLLVAVSPAAYRFAVEHGGLSISRFMPLAGAWIPAFVLAASSADHLLQRGLRRRWAALAAALAPAFATAAMSALQRRPLEPELLAFGALFVVGSAGFVLWRRPALLAVLAFATVAHYGARLRLLRPASEIHVGSPLIERLAAETRDGARFAWLGEPAGLPPRQEILHGLRSIHAYYSLPSEHYRIWATGLAPSRSDPAGRRFLQVEPAHADPGVLADAGVSIFLTTAAPPPGLAPGARVRLQPASREPVLEAQVRRFRLTRDEADSPRSARTPGTISDLPPEQRAPVERIVAHDDHLRFELESANEPTLLFVSQQYHPHWRAAAPEGGALETVRVNDLYLGVLVPERVTDVELRYEPWVQLAWVPQVVFVSAGTALGLLALARRRTDLG